MTRPICAVIAILASFAACAWAGDDSHPQGDPVLDEPTIHCLGMYWIIRGDNNRDAVVNVEYRKKGQSNWTKGPPLFRVDKEPKCPAQKGLKKKLAEDDWLFAGSIFDLTAATDYEIKLSLVDPDGGKLEKTLQASTQAVPALPKGLSELHVVPGEGGGNGTEAEPFKGLLTAIKASKPGSVYLLHKGTYVGTIDLIAGGEPAKPVVLTAAGDGEVIIDGDGKSIAIKAIGLKHVWIAGITIKNCAVGISANESSDIVIQRCRITSSQFGINFNVSKSGTVARFYVADNIIEGPCTWPRKKGIETPRGIQMVGSGHVICHNRIKGFGDAINTFQDSICTSIDIYGNELSELTDDGIELDYSNRNVRCFRNRITNAYQGISVQPVHGGPVYVLRNVLYNIELEPFKMHNSPSGALFIHNTVVKAGEPMVLATTAPVYNCVSRNNLFIGSAGRSACDIQAQMVRCDFDNDGFGGGPWQNFLMWNGNAYKTINHVKAKATVYRNAKMIDASAVFASGLAIPGEVSKQYDPSNVDVRLKDGSAAVDAGTLLPGLNDASDHAAPDLGAYEYSGDSSPRPSYGPRDAK